MQYRVNFDYRCREVHLEAGQVLPLTEVEARLLNQDAPGVVSPVTEKAAPVVDAPPADKAVKKAVRK